MPDNENQSLSPRDLETMESGVRKLISEILGFLSFRGNNQESQQKKSDVASFINFPLFLENSSRTRVIKSHLNVVCPVCLGQPTFGGKCDRTLREKRFRIWPVFQCCCCVSNSMMNRCPNRTALSLVAELQEFFFLQTEQEQISFHGLEDCWRTEMFLKHLRPKFWKRMKGPNCNFDLRGLSLRIPKWNLNQRNKDTRLYILCKFH